MGAMHLERWGITGILRLETGDDVSVYRVDRCVKPGRWWVKPEEVEIWELPDERQIRVSRRGNGTWQIVWQIER